MFLSAEQKDLVAGYVYRQEVPQLVAYLESLERPQVAPEQPPDVPALEAQAEAETAKAVADASA